MKLESGYRKNFYRGRRSRKKDRRTGILSHKNPSLVATTSNAFVLKYKYKQSPLPDGSMDWIAVLLIQVSKGPKTTPPFEALIDSGATNCLFHADVAAAVGTRDFKSGKPMTTGGVVANANLDLWGHEIRLHIGADSFKITGYFSDQLPIAALLGRNGFLTSTLSLSTRPKPTQVSS